MAVHTYNVFSGTLNPTHFTSLYTSAATLKKRYCSKMLLHVMSGRLVTSCLEVLQMFTDLKKIVH